MRSILTALGVIIGIVRSHVDGTAILGIDAGRRAQPRRIRRRTCSTSPSWPWRDASNGLVGFSQSPRIDVNYAQPVNDWIAEHPGQPAQAGGARRRLGRDDHPRRIPGGQHPRRWHERRTRPGFKSDMKEGRFFTEIESHSARNVAVIGFDVADALFPNEIAHRQDDPDPQPAVHGRGVPARRAASSPVRLGFRR